MIRLSFTCVMLTFAALLMLGQLPASAQANGNQGGRGGNRGGMDVRTYAEQLNLTDEQMTKINGIIATQNLAILQVLTAEQQQKLKELDAAQRLVNVMPTLGAIKLTAEQQPKVQAIRDAMMQEMRDSMQNGTAAPANGQNTRQNQMRTLQEKYSKQIVELLTPEQKTQLQSDLAQAYGKLQSSQMMLMGVSQELRTKIRDIRQDATKQADAVRDDAALKDEEMIAKLKDLFTKTVKQIMDLLTPEQQKSLKYRLAALDQEAQINFRSLMTLNLTDDQQTKVRGISRKASQDIQQVLTTEQQTKLQELRPRRGGNGAGAAQPTPAAQPAAQ